MAEARPPATFHGWLMRQRRREDPVGDLARDARDDDEWPRRARSRRTFECYLEQVGAIREAYTALRRGWREYERERLT